MIIDILAGKMNFDGKKVSPDARKGILRLSIDGLADSVKLQWLDREVNPPKIENEWPGPLTIDEVPSAKTGKVYVIKPMDNGPSFEKQFIWIQQSAAVDQMPSASVSPDNIAAVMNQIQLLAQIDSGKAALEMHSQVFGDDNVGDDQMLLDLAGHFHEGDDDDDEMDEEEAEQYEELIAQLFQGGQMDNGGNGENFASVLLSNPAVVNACIAQLVWWIAVIAASAGEANHVETAESPVSSPHQVQLSAILTSPSAIDSIIDAAETNGETLSRLSSLLPAKDTNLREILQSPQFSETLRSLTEGVYSDQFVVLCSALGLNSNDQEEIRKSKDPLELLCRLLEKKHKHM